MMVSPDKEQKLLVQERDLDQVFKGSYAYHHNSKNYSNESFLVLRDNDSNHHIYISDVHSSVHTGEFLKIKVLYEVNITFDPIYVCIMKSMGTQATIEKYKIDQKEKKISYHFQNPTRQNEGKWEKVIHGKVQISTPAFCTSMLTTASKKIEAIGRTKAHIITNKNIWRFEEEPKELDYFIEFFSSKEGDLNINGKNLHYSFYKLYQNEVGANMEEKEVEYYMSRHLAIPYKAVFPNDTSIQVKNLLMSETPYKGMF
jgi:hypothetical protein